MNSNYKERIINYLEETLGFSVTLEKLPDLQLKELPLYLKQTNSYYDMELDGHKLILTFSKENTPKTALQLKKIAQILFKSTEKKIIFGMDTQSPMLRKRLIQEKVNFIIPGSRLYLPELLTDIKEVYTLPQVFPNLLSPSAQLLLLYHLSVEYLDSFSFKEIAVKLEYTPKTITKIAAELKDKDICKITGTKEKRFSFDVNRKQLWKMVEPQMQSPIYKTYYSQSRENLSFCGSGNQGLAHYIYLPVLEKKISYAVFRPEFEELKEKNFWKYLDEVEGNIEIEVWKYNPRLLSKDGYIDLLSLHLCNREHADERVKVGIRDLLLKKNW
jgi:hypothetical protein